MNILLTLGRMPKGLELARGFAHQGCQVYVADPHKKHISKYSNSITDCFQVTAPNVSTESFLAELLEIVVTNSIDIVVPVSEESVYTAQIIEQLPEGVEYFGPGFDVARLLHNKYQFNQLLRSLDLPAPDSALLESDEAQSLINKHDCVLKPVHGSAGIDVQFIKRSGSLPAKTRRASMLQQQMKGRLFTSFSVARNGMCLGTGVYEGTIMTGSVAIAFQRIDDCPAVHDFVDTFIKQNNYTGFISFDLFIEEDGLAYAIECNARLTSGIHLLDNSDVARAVLNKDFTPPIRLKQQQAFQHFWPCLGATEMSLVTSAPFKKNLKHFLSSADVLWSKKDPLPFIMLNFCSGEILKKYFLQKMSLGEASICDIEWQEPSVQQLN